MTNAQIKSGGVDLHGLHMNHCDQGDYAGSCKYGDDDCPALSRTPSHGRVSDSEDGRLPAAPGLRGFAPEPAAQSQPKALVPDVDRLRAALKQIADMEPNPELIARAALRGHA